MHSIACVYSAEGHFDRGIHAYFEYHRMQNRAVGQDLSLSPTNLRDLTMTRGVVKLEIKDVARHADTPTVVQ